MRPRSLAILGAVTAVTVAAATYVTVRQPGQPSSAVAAAGPVVPDLAARKAQVARITLTRSSGATTLVRDGGRWVLPEKDNFPADGAKADKLLDQIAGLALLAPKTHNPELFSRLDVAEITVPESHAKQVDLTGADGRKLASLLLGRVRYGQSEDEPAGLYVRRVGEEQSWLAQGSVDLPAGTLDWADKQVADVDSGAVRHVVLKPAAGPALDFRRDAADQPFTAQPPAPDGRAWDTAQLKDLAATLQGLSFIDVRARAKAPALPADGDALTVETADGLTVTVTLYDLDGAPWAALSATGAGDAAAKASDLDARSKDWLFKLDDDRVRRIRSKPDDLLQKPKSS